MPATSEPTGGINFNPREWGDSDSKADQLGKVHAEAQTGGVRKVSFDPSTWVDPLQSGDTSDMPGEMPQPPAYGRGSARLLAAVGGLATVTIGVALVLIWLWSGEPAARAEQSAGPAAMAAADRLRESQNILKLTNLEDVDDALASSGVASSDIAEFFGEAISTAGSSAGPFRLVYGKRGDRLTFLELTRNDGSGFHIARTGEILKSERFDARLEQRFIPIRGTLGTDSFYSSAVAAGVDASLIDTFADAFAFDFDMQMDVQPDDVFEAMIVQSYNPTGEPVGTPRLLYVSLRTTSKSRALYWFDPANDEPGWFDGNGSSIIRNLMRTPLNGARVTSRFGPRRHPITGFTRVHRGTDYAAPIGTPVYASGEGIVIKKGWGSGGAGNMVALQHNNGWVTKYLHLSAFAPGLEVGQRVNQGDIIAAVGNTGASTGPHLHYEVWIDGEAIDPQTIDTGTGKQLLSQTLASFMIARDMVDAVRAEQRLGP